MAPQGLALAVLWESVCSRLLLSCGYYIPLPEHIAQPVPRFSLPLNATKMLGHWAVSPMMERAGPSVPL